MAYSKICPICSKSFFCKKVSTIFCSKRCNNRARSLPEPLRISLVTRANAYILKADKYVAEVPDKDGNITKVGYVPDAVTDANPLGKDAGYILALAKEKKQKQEEEKQRLELEKQRSLQSSSGFNEVNNEDAGFGSHEVDPEMLAMMHKMDEKDIPTITTTEEKLEEVLSKIRKPTQTTSTDTSNTPRKYKIKKFGDK